MKELLTALCKAKQLFTSIKKDKVNPHFKSKYASLDSVLAAVEPGLLAHELILTSLVAEGNLTTRLYHSSGECLESTFALPNLSDPQKLGSTISYYRRYAISGLLGVTADEDDDANGAKPVTSQSAYATPAKPAAALPNSELGKIETQKQALRECMEILGYDQNQKTDFAKAINAQSFPAWTLANWELAVVKALSAIDQMNDSSGSVQ